MNGTMRIAALLLSLTLISCRENPAEPVTETAPPPPATTTTAAQTTTDDKSDAEKAFNAGMRGKQKAEQIQDQSTERTEETNTAGY
jgi:hypothetical protein